MVAFAYSALVYLGFLASFLYAVAFVEDLPVPHTVDSGGSGPVALRLAIDAGLLALFAVQHSVMARPAFKRVWTRVIPASVERSTYVLAASLALIVLCLLWRGFPATVWRLDGPLAVVLTALSYLGWGIVLLTTFLLDHFELFGLRQTWSRLRGKDLPAPVFRTPLFYGVVRHPLYFGFLLAFWAAPHMTWGRLLFALGATGYILVAIILEERDLVSVFGETYVAYRARVSMIIPAPPRRHPG